MAILTMFAGVAGCAVVETRPVGEMSIVDGRRPACNSALGYYALPKAFIQIKLTRKASEAAALDIPDPAEIDRPWKIIRTPDPILRYCMDYQGSAFHTDTVQVLRSHANGSTATSANTINAGNSASGFLSAIIINSEDETVRTFKRLIEAGAKLVSGARSASRSEPEGDIIDGTFDPFDLRQTSNINAAMRPFGYCIVLEGITVNPGGENVDAYCNNSRLFLRGREFYAQAYDEMKQARTEAAFPGFYYRLPQRYVLAIYKKSDPGAPGRWQPWKSESVYLENLSPVVAVGIARGVFSGRRSAFIFEEGALTNMCVAKTSELNGAIGIPYEFVRALIKIPTQIAQVKYDRIENEKQLIAIRRQMAEIQIAQLQAIKNNVAYSAPSGFTAGRPSDLQLTQFTDPNVSNDGKSQPDTEGRLTADFNKALKGVCGENSATNPFVP